MTKYNIIAGFYTPFCPSPLFDGGPCAERVNVIRCHSTRAVVAAAAQRMTCGQRCELCLAGFALPARARSVSLDVIIVARFARHETN